MSQAELVVGLYRKLERVSDHWGLVNVELPAAYPLVLLQGVGRTEFDQLTERLPELRTAMRQQKFEMKLAWEAYRGQKGIIHDFLRVMNVWMRAYFKETPWIELMPRVPGRLESYGRWWNAAMDMLCLWKRMVEEQPENPGWPMDLGAGRTLEQFEAAIAAFESARGAILPAEMDWKLAREVLRGAQRETTALLMAYGHGVRARLGHEGRLVRTIPKVWPGTKTASVRSRRPPARRRAGIRNLPHS